MIHSEALYCNKENASWEEEKRMKQWHERVKTSHAMCFISLNTAGQRTHSANTTCIWHQMCFPPGLFWCVTNETKCFLFTCGRDVWTVQNILFFRSYITVTSERFAGRAHDTSKTSPRFEPTGAERAAFGKPLAYHWSRKYDHNCGFRSHITWRTSRRYVKKTQYRKNAKSKVLTKLTAQNFS